MIAARQLRLTRLINFKSIQQTAPLWQAIILAPHSGAISCNTTFVRWKADDRRELIKSTPKKDMGTAGETSVNIDFVSKSKDDMFPDHTTPDRLFNGVRFADIPICKIKTTPNNTIIHTIKAHGNKTLAYRSCGMEGFKNTRKGTNIAAQATAITHSNILKEKGIKTIRVQIQGLGPGRMSSVKGLQMAGMEIISVTDSTRISDHPPRPKKQRRL